MNKEELIGKLQMVYVGDKNALNELVGYYDGLKEIIQMFHQENQQLKQKLNWIAFGDDSELALRYLRKIGYVDFDEERKVYINKHNNDPFYLNDEEEKDYYIKDDELNEYTQQLEYKLNKKQEQLDLYKSVFDEVRKYIDKRIGSSIRLCDILEILDKANIKESE